MPVMTLEDVQEHVADAADLLVEATLEAELCQQTGDWRDVEANTARAIELLKEATKRLQRMHRVATKR